MKTYKKKLSYIDTSFICSDEPKKVNRDKILMQKTHKRTPRETTNASNVHHQQYSSYNDTPNRNAKKRKNTNTKKNKTKIKTTSNSDN